MKSGEYTGSHQWNNSHRAKAGICSPLVISTAYRPQPEMEAHILLKHRRGDGLEHDLEHLSRRSQPFLLLQRAHMFVAQLPTLSYPFGGRSCNILPDTVTVSLPPDVAFWNLGSNNAVLEGLGSCPWRSQVPGSCRSTGSRLIRTPLCQQRPATPPLSLKAPRNSKTRVCSTTLQLYASTSSRWTITPS